MKPPKQLRVTFGIVEQGLEDRTSCPARRSVAAPAKVLENLAGEIPVLSLEERHRADRHLVAMESCGEPVSSSGSVLAMRKIRGQNRASSIVPPEKGG